MDVHMRMGSEHYALSIHEVHEVADLGEVTPLPGAPRPFLGVRNLRGEVLPVIDLAGLLGVEAAGPPERVVVAQTGAFRAGLAVEAVVGVVELPESDTPVESAALKGAVLVDGTLIGIVDLPEALAGLVGAGTT
ncbi:MAG: purine-binding chemotaxis protein CheW [Solirubrobacteraceae bacterium]|jgi:purine-binding chemotaxis protein CheW|nr:purine-binding chemotaxis protein CheW [Solirubrobacteraceae bacterium]